MLALDKKYYTNYSWTQNEENISRWAPNSSWAYYTSGNALHVHFAWVLSFNSHHSTLKKESSSPFCRWGNWGPGRSNNLPKISVLTLEPRLLTTMSQLCSTPALLVECWAHPPVLKDLWIGLTRSTHRGDFGQKRLLNLGNRRDMLRGKYRKGKV